MNRLRSIVPLGLCIFMMSTASAGERILPLDGSDKRFKPADFGYEVHKLIDGDRVRLFLMLNEKAAKGFRSARLRLEKGNKAVVETTLGLETINAPAGHKMLTLTLDPRVIDQGELVILHGQVEGQPRLNGIDGFRFSIRLLLARPESVPDGGTVR